MSIVDQIERLQELHARGALTDAEFAQAKAAVLADQGSGAASADTHQPLTDLRFESELARIDREWELEREQYMVSGRYGRSIPSAGMSLVAGVIGVSFGLFWTSMTASAGIGPFMLFGILWTGIAGYLALTSFTKASAYQQAERAYQERRAALLAQHPRYK